MDLIIKNLSKTYPNGVKALDNVSLTIPQGMFGLLGPNGAGKSSLMRTIATLQAPDSGSIHLDAIDALHDQMALRRVLGYLPQEFGVYPRVSAEDLLDHMAVVKGIVNRGERRETVKALLEQTNLYEVRKRSISTFSGGMKQRFGIAQALIGQPLLIIVDEPTAGLDPGERNRFYNLLSEIGENIIVILSTHIVDDVRELCRNMAIINQGRVLFAGQPQAAMHELKGRIWERTIDKAELAEYQQQYSVISTKLLAGQPLLHVVGEELEPAGFQAVEPSLEDVFFSTIQGKAAAQSVSVPA
ncbi:ABC transporter ATP-binding protein [Hymenobacter chitinivorans]|uniref:ABC-type multidrug transport system ATPase subunit n=1 Tax=Hymenobacter chitinivorans DSM 11115 TaxID=1121954 RepID=A0A2M9BT99_9BACT|nr:ABC transporter ATP-binding protein [Hymenobacter chitinivorans]PJJ61157.1 ABC-type multidrug transport system ATPase subunit [Hymenobacter chitinivorans DSM 11115]